MISKFKRLLITATVGALLSMTVTAQAVPTLQVGAPGATPGSYEPYQDSLTSPLEEDTAVTTGSILYVAGAYKNNPEILIGGQYDSAGDWSSLGFDSAFDEHRAVLMATVPDGSLGVLGNSIEIDGNSAFYQTSLYEDGFSVTNPPSNHDPIKDQDYLFFDIGDFAQLVAVPDFDTGIAGTQQGEIKTLTLDIAGYDWVHFDVFAIVTVGDTSYTV
ncbi:MAG: PEP-CTERM sorting domain-containing protein, partial [Nitrospirales bacterium]|nr:PEP-CTERM sorting domain-containing protein [Nitrospirales bacterium]